jgi:hypothetical protein
MVEMMEEPKCATCPMHLKAEERPKSLMARFWRWHTTWCPGWKAYQEYLAQKGED